METNSDYLALTRAHFNQWDDAVGVLAAEGKKADGEARTAYQRRLKELRLARNTAQRAFDTLRAASGPAAARSQAAMQEARDAMQEALLKVTADLHAPPRDIRPLAEPEPQAEAEVAPETTPDPPPPSATQPAQETTP